MRTLYEYLAIIGWAWFVLVVVVLGVLHWRRSRRAVNGFDVAAIERHEKQP